jgi:hypothetical protein
MPKRTDLRSKSTVRKLNQDKAEFIKKGIVPKTAAAHSVLAISCGLNSLTEFFARRKKHSTSDAGICTPAVARAHSVLVISMSCDLNSLAVLSARRNKHSVARTHRVLEVFCYSLAVRVLSEYSTSDAGICTPEPTASWRCLAA